MREAPGTTFKLADLLARPVPRFRIVSPAAGCDRSAAAARRSRSPSRQCPIPIKAIRVQVNGRQVEEITPDIGAGGFEPASRSSTCRWPRAATRCASRLTNAIGEKAETVILDPRGRGRPRQARHALHPGHRRRPISGPRQHLRPTARRAATCASPAPMRAPGRKRSRGGSGLATPKWSSACWSTARAASDAPTATNILDAIDLLKQAKETDTVLLFIAGHGINDGPNYRFLATNAERDRRRLARLDGGAVADPAGGGGGGQGPAHPVPRHLPLGQRLQPELGNAAYHANIIAYTSARFDQEALEDAKLGHGLFTYAVVEGLDGKGALAAKREISTKGLAEYVIKRVDELAKAHEGRAGAAILQGPGRRGLRAGEVVAAVRTSQLESPFLSRKSSACSRAKRLFRATRGVYGRSPQPPPARELCVAHSTRCGSLDLLSIEGFVRGVSQ